MIQNKLDVSLPEEAVELSITASTVLNSCYSFIPSSPCHDQPISGREACGKLGEEIGRGYVRVEQR